MSEEHPTMQFLQRDGVRTGIKISLLVIVTLMFLIPMAMLGGLVAERRDRRDYAVGDVVSSWGGSQTIAGPLLSIPVVARTTDANGRKFTSEERWNVIPERLQVIVRLDPEIRRRGIYEIPLYRTTIEISGVISVPAEPSLGIQNEHEIRFADAQLVTAISGIAGLRDQPRVRWNEVEIGVTSSTTEIGWITTGVAAPVGNNLEAGQEQHFTMELTLTGGGGLQILPLAESSTVQMVSSWPSPSFTGGMLPTTRAVTSEGFEATWATTSLSLGIPDSWLENDMNGSRIAVLPFGVEMFYAVDHYFRVSRSVKYGILFVLLPFVALFVMETVSRRRIHPVQYLLIAAAKVVFFLVLLSLTEHMEFGWSYLIAAGVTTFLVTYYTYSALRWRNAGLVIGCVLVAEYVFLYAALASEDYALLIGSVGMLVVLGLVMVLTRKIDWYVGQAAVSSDEQRHV